MHKFYRTFCFVLCVLFIGESRASNVMEVDLGAIAPGDLKVVIWNGLPIGVYHRTKKDIDNLQHARFSDFADAMDERLVESLRWETEQYGKDVSFLYGQQTMVVSGGPLRSLRSDYFIFVNISTVLGCSLNLVNKSEQARHLFDPCHQVRFDMAGRIFREEGHGYWRNLFVPPHRFIGVNKLVLGKTDAPALAIRFRPDFSQFAADSEDTLFLAALWRDWPTIEKSLERDIKLSFLTTRRVAAIFNIVQHAPLPLLQRAITAELPIDAVSPTGATPLAAVLLNGDVERVALLLAAKADPNGVRPLNAKEHKTPLHFLFGYQPVSEGTIAAASLLLHSGASPKLRFQQKSPCELAQLSDNNALRQLFAPYCR